MFTERLSLSATAKNIYGYHECTCISFRKPQPVKPTKKSGCYVATCVYGSYDCPQVWTLRRYRDNVLATTWYGRAFIAVYYFLSPLIIKWFGNTIWFKNACKRKLDSFVKYLQRKGINSTPYTDR